MVAMSFKQQAALADRACGIKAVDRLWSAKIHTCYFVPFSRPDHTLAVVVASEYS